MPSPRPILTHQTVTTYVADHVFGTASRGEIDDHVARHSVGIELEWLTSYRCADQRVTLAQIEALFADLGALPGGSRLTLEPGGQIELSSARGDTLDQALTAMGTDLFVLDRACAQRRIELIALGADPTREPARILEAPRYEAMEEFFDHDGPAGRAMMCNTASIQLNIGLGPESAMAARWRLAHAISPTLIACFANSPFAGGMPSGWQSTRLRSWWTLDPSRAAPPDLVADPIAAWVDYALDARVMFIAHDDAYLPVTTGLTFRQWLHDGHELGSPTLDDFAYHLTTLFPPVRPRGWFELRVFDALPTPFWQVAAAVTHALLVDPEAAAAALSVVAGTEDLWVDAAQLGLGHPALGHTAIGLFEIALAALDRRSPDDEAVTDVVANYFDRWVARGRTPADDRLAAWRRDGTLIPPRASPVPYARELVSEAP